MRRSTQGQGPRARRGGRLVPLGSSGRYGLAPLADRRTKGPLGRENGQAAVEFALVVPLICVLVFVFFDFSRFIYYWFDLNRVANEGARIAAVNSPGLTPDVIKNRFLFDQKASSSVAICFTTSAVGEPVTVQVSVPYSWAKLPSGLPFVGGYSPGSLTLKARATMRQEQKATFAASGACT